MRSRLGSRHIFSTGQDIGCGADAHAPHKLIAIDSKPGPTANVLVEAEIFYADPLHPFAAQ